MKYNETLNCTDKKGSRQHYLMLFFLFLYFCGSYVLNVFTWGRYVYLLAIVLIIISRLLSNNYKLRLYRGKYADWLFSFTFFCLVSILWAWNASAAWGRANTVLIVSLCSYFIYTCVKDELSIREILNVIMFSGYIEALYLFLSYGVSDLLTGGARLSNDLGNANFVSFLMSVSLVITLDEMLNERFCMYHLMAVPSLYILAIGQSRTALIGALFGFLILCVMKAFRSKQISNTFAKLVLYLLLGVIILFIMAQMDIFSGVIERMANLIASYTGKGTIAGGERSVTSRRMMIALGLEYFAKYPILGVGIGNSSVITQRELGWSTYLHNNFVELLATTGIVGFFIYYSAFIGPLVCLIKYRKYKNREYDVVFALLMMLLLMDYGTISFYTKDTYIYFMVFFLEQEALKKNYEEYTHGAIKL